MNNKKSKIREGYYICSECGDLVKYADLLNACNNGGMPYCYCKFEDRKLFVGYKRISKKFWEDLKDLKNNNLRIKKYNKFRISKFRRKK